MAEGRPTTPVREAAARKRAGREAAVQKTEPHRGALRTLVAAGVLLAGCVGDAADVAPTPHESAGPVVPSALWRAAPACAAVDGSTGTWLPVEGEPSLVAVVDDGSRVRCVDVRRALERDRSAPGVGVEPIGAPVPRSANEARSNASAPATGAGLRDGDGTPSDSDGPPAAALQDGGRLGHAESAAPGRASSADGQVGSPADPAAREQSDDLAGLPDPGAADGRAVHMAAGDPVPEPL
ncbi:MAG: hypothetical protein ACFCGT_11735 [Sandaracinaceae bacterium]